VPASEARPSKFLRVVIRAVDEVPLPFGLRLHPSQESSNEGVDLPVCPFQPARKDLGDDILMSDLDDAESIQQ